MYTNSNVTCGNVARCKLKSIIDLASRSFGPASWLFWEYLRFSMNSCSFGVPKETTGIFPFDFECYWACPWLDIHTQKPYAGIMLNVG